MLLRRHYGTVSHHQARRQPTGHAACTPRPSTSRNPRTITNAAGRCPQAAPAHGISSASSCPGPPLWWCATVTDGAPPSPVELPASVGPPMNLVTWASGRQAGRRRGRDGHEAQKWATSIWLPMELGKTHAQVGGVTAVLQLATNLSMSRIRSDR
jgi:hypothetical protein